MKIILPVPVHVRKDNPELEGKNLATYYAKNLEEVLGDAFHIKTIWVEEEWQVMLSDLND